MVTCLKVLEYIITFCELDLQEGVDSLNTAEMDKVHTYTNGRKLYQRLHHQTKSRVLLIYMN